MYTSTDHISYFAACEAYLRFPKSVRVLMEAGSDVEVPLQQQPQEQQEQWGLGSL